MAQSDKRPGRPVSNRAQVLQTISARRRALKLSQQDVATKLGVHQAYLSDLETGRRTLSLDRLLDLLNLLGLELLVQPRSSKAKVEW
jgi:HTH-type transcriptional regulator/antitoxin HipB